MKKFLRGKGGAVLLVLVLIAVLAVGAFYINDTRSYNSHEVELYQSSFVDISVASEKEVLVERADGVIFYEVAVRLDLDLNLLGIPLEGEEALDVETLVFYDWDGLLRGTLVSIEPELEFFSVDDVLMLEVDDDELSMTLPGDVLTFFCEVKVPADMCYELEDGTQSCFELLKLENCVLARVSR